MKTHSINGFGAVFAEVRVDVDLCTIRATRIVGSPVFVTNPSPSIPRKSPRSSSAKTDTCSGVRFLRLT